MIGNNRFVRRVPVAIMGIFFMITALSCGSSGGSGYGGTIAGAEVAHEAVLRTIPDSVLTTIRSTFEVAYFHTSHGTHVSYAFLDFRVTKPETVPDSV